MDRRLNPALIEEPVPLSGRDRRRILTYVGVLVVLLGLGDPMGGLIGIPLSFFLKNKLHLTSQESAVFGAIASAPVYLAAVFGFVRDHFNPLGRGDRGFLIVFGSTTAGLYLTAAFMPPSAGVLLAIVPLLVSSFQFVSSAQNGLMSQLARQHGISGHASATQNFALYLLWSGAALAGGFLSTHLDGQSAEGAARRLFMVGAGLMGCVALYGLFRPRVVYDGLRRDPAAEAAPRARIGQLLRHWPVYPALLIWLFWNFNPGALTPLQYHLQDRFHATDLQWAQYLAITNASFLPSYILYGWLCRRFHLRAILFWGTLVAVPQFVGLAFISSVSDAFVAGVFIGMMGGVATAAYMDLLIRSCPPGLEGTVLMMSWALFTAAQRGADIFGAYLYETSGAFLTCIIAVTGVYACILPLLALVPKTLTLTRDR